MDAHLSQRDIGGPRLSILRCLLELLPRLRRRLNAGSLQLFSIRKQQQRRSIERLTEQFAISPLIKVLILRIYAVSAAGAPLRSSTGMIAPESIKSSVPASYPRINSGLVLVLKEAIAFCIRISLPPCPTQVMVFTFWELLYSSHISCSASPNFPVAPCQKVNDSAAAVPLKIAVAVSAVNSEIFIFS